MQTKEVNVTCMVSGCSVRVQKYYKEIHDILGCQSNWVVCRKFEFRHIVILYKGSDIHESKNYKMPLEFSF